MSRSHKGSKGPGYEYWSKRPCAGLTPGAETKRMTHKLERLEAKEEISNIIKEIIREEIAEPDYHDEIEGSLYCHIYGPCQKCRENNG